MIQAKYVRHRPYLATTAQQNPTPDQIKQDYAAMLQNMRNYLREMSVSEKLGSDMLATLPERVHNLTEAELKEYGLMGVDPVEQQRRLFLASDAAKSISGQMMPIDNDMQQAS